VVLVPERSKLPQWAKSFPREDGFDEPALEWSASGSEWWNLFTDVPRTRRERITNLKPVGMAIIAIIAITVVAWILLPSVVNSSGKHVSAPTTPAGPSLDPGAENRLMHLLPPGYNPNTCTPSATPDAMAQAICGQSVDPDGPAAATFTLVRDNGVLRAAFDDIVRRVDVTACPGNIQSPGPWHTSTTPQKSSGTLVCGFQGDVPMMAWTKDRDLLVSIVQADRHVHTLDELYRWWSTQ
jgi:serine/threonine kinase PknH